MPKSESVTEPTDAVKYSAALSRWRASLLEYDAAERQRIAGDDPSPTARGFAASAESKEAEATIHLDLAEAEEAFSVAKQERNADPKDDRAARRYEAARDALVELRQHWRGIDEVVGNRTFVQSLDHFPEPSAEQLIGKEV